MREGRKEREGYGESGYIPQGCDSRTMYGYWAAGGIDSHDEGATDHPETETPAVPASPASLLRVLHPPRHLYRFVRTYNHPHCASIRWLNTLLGSYTIFPQRAGTVIPKTPTDP